MPPEWVGWSRELSEILEVGHGPTRKGTPHVAVLAHAGAHVAAGVALLRAVLLALLLLMLLLLGKVGHTCPEAAVVGIIPTCKVFIIWYMWWKARLSNPIFPVAYWALEKLVCLKRWVVEWGRRLQEKCHFLAVPQFFWTLFFSSGSQISCLCLQEKSNKYLQGSAKIAKNFWFRFFWLRPYVVKSSVISNPVFPVAYWALEKLVCLKRWVVECGRRRPRQSSVRERPKTSFFERKKLTPRHKLLQRATHGKRAKKIEDGSWPPGQRGEDGRPESFPISPLR